MKRSQKTLVAQNLLSNIKPYKYGKFYYKRIAITVAIVIFTFTGLCKQINSLSFLTNVKNILGLKKTQKYQGKNW